MSTKKRLAEFQLTKDEGEDIVGDGVSTDITSEVRPSDIPTTADPPATGGFGFGAYSKINPFASVIASASTAFGSSSVPEESPPVPTFGFGSYANTNPFAAATAAVPAFTTAPSNTPMTSSFGFPSSGFSAKNTFASPLQISVMTANENSTSAIDCHSATVSGTVAATVDGMVRPSSFSNLPTNVSSFSSYTTKAPFAVIIPSPLTLSPKAQNPFSNPSPKHNPFVTIVESKDNLWSAASRSSSGTCASTTGAGAGALSGSSSFPFPSSAATSSKSSSATLLNGGAEGLEGSDKEKSDKGEKSEKGVGEFGTAVSSSRLSSGGEDDEAKADQYAEDQVYGKVYPMPDNVTVVTGEENEDCVMQIRAKLFRLSVPTVSPLKSMPSSGSSGQLLDLIVRENKSAAESVLDSVSGIEGKEENKEENNDVEENMKESISNNSYVEKDKADTSEKEGKGENNEIELKDPEKKKSLGEWIEVGIGPVRILKERENYHSNNNGAVVNSTSNKRMVMRREDKKGGKGTKLLLNTLLKGYIILKKQGDRTFHLTCLSENNSMGNLDLSTYMIQTKQPQEADRLFEAINNFVIQDRKQTPNVQSI